MASADSALRLSEPRAKARKAWLVASVGSIDMAVLAQLLHLDKHFLVIFLNAEREAGPSEHRRGPGRGLEHGGVDVGEPSFVGIFRAHEVSLDGENTVRGAQPELDRSVQCEGIDCGKGSRLVLMVTFGTPAARARPLSYTACVQSHPTKATSAEITASTALAPKMKNRTLEGCCIESLSERLERCRRH